MSILSLRRGDDSDFLGRQIRIKLNTDLDLTGYKAIVKIQGICKEFNDISSKVITLVLTAEETKQLNLNSCCCYLKLIEPNGRQGTIDFKLHTEIANEVIQYE
jgi:hypothetical protein